MTDSDHRGLAGPDFEDISAGQSIGAMLRNVIAVVRRNPVRFRAVLVAVLVAAGWYAPDVLDPEAQDAVLGAVMALAALIFGWDASRRVVLPADVEDEAA